MKQITNNSDLKSAVLRGERIRVRFVDPETKEEDLRMRVENNGNYTPFTVRYMPTAQTYWYGFTNEEGEFLKVAGIDQVDLSNRPDLYVWHHTN